METSYQKEIYQPRLKAGIEYQDYVMMHLHIKGIILQPVQSQKYQLKRENLLGMEIKFDRKMAETGNLYIETHEKADPRNERYALSGIYRDDDSWLFGIGNHDEFFIFGKKVLFRLLISHQETLRKIENPTSKGVLIPKKIAEEYAEKHVVFK